MRWLFLIAGVLAIGWLVASWPFLWEVGVLLFIGLVYRVFFQREGSV